MNQYIHMPTTTNERGGRIAEEGPTLSPSDEDEDSTRTNVMISALLPNFRSNKDNEDICIIIFRHFRTSCDPFQFAILVFFFCHFTSVECWHWNFCMNLLEMRWGLEVTWDIYCIHGRNFMYKNLNLEFKRGKKNLIRNTRRIH